MEILGRPLADEIDKAGYKEAHLVRQHVPVAGPQHAVEVRRHAENSNITQEAVQSLEVSVASATLPNWLIAAL